MSNNQPDFLKRFVQVYPIAPSLALWRAVEAQVLSQVFFEPPVLDLACGTGQFTEILLGAGVTAGCDLDAQAVKAAHRRNIYQLITLADARALPYSKGSFRTVISNCAIEHIPEVEQTLVEVTRVLDQGGIFVFTVPSEYFNNWLFFPRFYHRLGLHGRAEAQIKHYNAGQKHYNIDPLHVWQERLERTGMYMVEHHYYMPAKIALVFSFWDELAKWTIRIPVAGSQISVLDCLFRVIPRRCLIWIWSNYLGGYYKTSLNTSQGSGLLIVARKEGKKG